MSISLLSLCPHLRCASWTAWLLSDHPHRKPKAATHLLPRALCFLSSSSLFSLMFFSLLRKGNHGQGQHKEIKYLKFLILFTCSDWPLQCCVNSLSWTVLNTCIVNKCGLLMDQTRVWISALLLPNAWLQMSYPTLLSLSVLLCQMGILIVSLPVGCGNSCDNLRKSPGYGAWRIAGTQKAL